MTISKRSFLKGALSTMALAPLAAAEAKKAVLPKKWDIVTDVAVLGYGGAGACAAIAAKDAGVTVMIFEKCETGGGNTALSSGGMMIPNDEEAAFNYLNHTYDFANSVKDEEQLRAFVKEAMQSKDFLMSTKN